MKNDPDGRNVRLTSIAGSLRREGLDESEILGQLLDHPERDDLPESEVRSIAKSMMKYTAGSNGTQPSPKPLKEYEKSARFSESQLLRAKREWEAMGEQENSPVSRWLQPILPSDMTAHGAMRILGDSCGYALWHDQNDKKTEMRGRPAIVMPYRTTAGEITGSVKVRFLDRPGDGWQKSKSYGPVNLIGAQRLKEFDTETPLFLLAGERDWIAGTLRGLQAVAQPGEGIKKLIAAEVDRLRDFEAVYVLYDDDEAGHEMAPKMAAALAQHGVRAQWIRPSAEWPGKDLSDWLAAGISVENIADHCKAHAEDPPADVARKMEVTIGTDENRVNDEVVEALVTDLDLFQRGKQLVTIVRDAAARHLDRAPGSPTICAVPLAQLPERIARAVSFKKRRKGEDERAEAAHPPDWCVRVVHARMVWDGIRPLAGIVEHPTLRADGSVLDQPGHDAEMGLLYIPNCEYPSILADPTSDDVAKAIASLKEVVAEFPFKADAHRSAWLSGLLTLLARHAFEGPAPLFLIDANVRGSGKTLLADVISMIATGRAMPRTAYASKDEEMAKRITASCLAGDRAVFIDNIGTIFGCPSLDSALTGVTWRERILGKSENTPELPLNIVWFGSGNNIALRGDVARRICHIRLQSDMERPEERSEFSHPDLLGWVREERPRLIVAGLTILRGYFTAGCPKQSLKAWGSFEGWSKLIRSAICWSGEPDPGETREELVNEADTEGAALARLLEGWAEIDPNGDGMTVAAALRELEKTENADEYEALRSALTELVPLKNGKFNARSLGMKLHHLRDRVVGGRHLRRRDSDKGAVWRVCTVSGSESPGTNETTGTTTIPRVEKKSAGTPYTYIEGTEASPCSPLSPGSPPSPQVSGVGSAYAGEYEEI